MKISHIALLAGIALTGCQTTVNPSESFYTSSETMRSQNVSRCTVLEARQVRIGAQERRTRGGFRRTFGQPEQQIGALLGAALGGVIGNEIDDGLGTAVGAVIGGVAGRAGGTQLSRNRRQQPGVEYSVLLAGGREKVITQYVNRGDRIAAPGTTCRIARGPNGERVLPASHLPGQVNRPRRTSFAN